MEIDIDIDDIIMSCNKREKKDLYRALLEDDDVLSEKERMQKKREEQLAEEFHLMRTLEAMSQYELKKTLCNLLGSHTGSVPLCPDSHRKGLLRSNPTNTAQYGEEYCAVAHIYKLFNY